MLSALFSSRCNLSFFSLFLWSFWALMLMHLSHLQCWWVLFFFSQHIWLLVTALFFMGWSSYLSSIQVYLSLLSICFVEKIISREWTYIFWTRICVCHHSLALFNSEHFWVLICATSGVLSPLSHLRVLVILFPCYLSIKPFSCVLSLPLFYSKIVLNPLHPVVGMSSSIPFQLVGRIFFLCFDCIDCLRLGDH